VEKLSWKFEAITVLTCFEILKIRWKVIGRYKITSYISLVLIEKRIFNLLRDIQTCSNKCALDKHFNYWVDTLNATPHWRWRQHKQPAWSCYAR